MARVLVVEDNEINLELMRYLLAAFGHEVFGAGNGVEALKMLPDLGPDVVVCDIEMPRMDGVAFARAVRADPARAALPLLAVTSSAMVGDRDRIMAAGFDGYHAKPIDTQRFVPWRESHLPPGARRSAAAPAAASVAAPGETAGDAPAPAAAPPSGPLVLVLDDEPANLALKRSCLEPLGYRVTTTASADEALRLALQRPPQLIISDVGMPVSDGFEFIGRVKQEPALRRIPFVFISATHWDDASRDKALALGALRYLKRPLPTEQLISEVERALDSA